MTTKRAGFYFNTRTWELELHRNDGSTLPDGGSGTQVRVPALAMLVLGPVLGFLFVIFLPFIGFALGARELGRRVAASFGRKTAAGRASSGPARS